MMYTIRLQSRHKQTGKNNTKTKCCYSFCDCGGSLSVEANLCGVFLSFVFICNAVGDPIININKYQYQ